MRRYLFLPIILLVAPLAFGQSFQSGSNESDGDLDLSSISQNTAVTLRQIKPDADTDGDNIYHFRNITIPAGRSLIITRYDVKRLGPVHFLASGTVRIDGGIHILADSAETPANVFEPEPSYSFSPRAEPGPGGYPGSPLRSTRLSHLGLGWTNRDHFSLSDGANCFASHASADSIRANSPINCGNAQVYGNDQVNPLTGGTGGGNYKGVRGGGGGGAFRLRASTLIFGGTISATGGNGALVDTECSGPGSGGSVRVEANQITASNAVIVVRGGLCSRPAVPFPVPGSGFWVRADPGRIRVEANSATGTISRIEPTSPSGGTSPISVQPLSTTPTNTSVPSLNAIAVILLGGASPPVKPPFTDATNQETFLNFTANLIVAPGSSAPAVVIVEAKDIPISTKIVARVDFAAFGGAVQETAGIDFACTDLSGDFSQSFADCYIYPELLGLGGLGWNFPGISKLGVRLYANW